MSMDGKSRISLAALSEVESAFKDYYSVVEASDLAQSSQATYIDHARGFVRWLKGDFDPGSRKAPYRKPPQSNIENV